VDNFDQSDLNDEDVYLLDTFTQLFVWIGGKSTQEEKDKAVDFAAAYARDADDGRDPDLPIIRVIAGEEPPMFSCHFHGWDAEYASKRSFKDPYQVCPRLYAEFTVPVADQPRFFSVLYTGAPGGPGCLEEARGRRSRCGPEEGTTTL
jgi:hypothetical protein